VYLDIEGIPDSDSYYLIGALVVCEEQQTFHSFWADQRSQEPEIFARFAEVICALPDFRVLHFGDYETVALKRMKARLPESLHQTIDVILAQATNVLSVIHPHVYFPTYSNGLKEIGRFLGFVRDDDNATGLQSIVWRKMWQENKAPDIKARLLQYNQDDCRTLKLVCESIRKLTLPSSETPTPALATFKAARTQQLIEDRPRWELFGTQEYASADLKKVVKCAYFDYQREKVFLRTHPHFKVVNKKRRKSRPTSLTVNAVDFVEGQRCPQCRTTKINKGKQRSQVLVDSKFFKGGMKKWVTRTVSWRYRCSRCKHVFYSGPSHLHLYEYGYGLMSWLVYSNVACGVNMLQVQRSLADVFSLAIAHSKGYMSKGYIAALYQSLYSELLQSILESAVIHVDETTVQLRKQKGYVWVMTTMDKVYYFYKPSREAVFLQAMLANFSGVLISDFYPAYDSLKCKQQKCLVHLVRDIDEDLLRHPLDLELKRMAQEFGTLLRTIIETVDRWGLKSRHLRKHKRSVHRFLESVASAEFSSALANKYKKRFEKSGGKMFTFLDHDGVPWNNNNAEHAIKRVSCT
jgi:hypothetical protein